MGYGRKASPARIGSLFKEMKALQLRLEGKSLLEIAEKLGNKSPSTAYNAIMKGIERVQEHMKPEAEAVLTMELLRLDRYHETFDRLFHDVAENEVSTKTKIFRLSKIWMSIEKVMEKRAKYLGLFKPEKFDLNADITSRVVRLPSKKPIGAPVSRNEEKNEATESPTIDDRKDIRPI